MSFYSAHSLCRRSRKKMETGGARTSRASRMMRFTAGFDEDQPPFAAAMVWSVPSARDRSSARPLSACRQFGFSSRCSSRSRTRRRARTYSIKRSSKSF